MSEHEQATVPVAKDGARALEQGEDERATKRVRIEDSSAASEAQPTETTATTADTNGHQNGNAAPVDARDRRSGLVAIKKEFLVDISERKSEAVAPAAMDDDEAEGRGGNDRGDDRDRPNKFKGKKKGKGGQNIERTFGKFDDALPLCNSRAFYPEFSPRECRFGDGCRLCHDVRKYLSEGRRADSETFEGKCPVFGKHGYCPSGWKCRFVRSHMDEIEREDGRKELVLIDNSAPAANGDADKATERSRDAEEVRLGVHNIVSMDVKIELNRKRVDFSQAETYIKWLDSESSRNNDLHHMRRDASDDAAQEIRAQFVDPPFKASEKRRLYFGPETPTLAPLTTQGNLPFRRLCVELGAQLTYSEMAFGMPLLQGTKADWTLMKTHDSELSPPKFTPGKTFVFDNYSNANDLKFGAQISGSAHWVVTKAANILSRECPKLRVIDLNCGCPIDMVFKQGGGSALLDAHGKLERMIRGMNAVSGEIPITAKIRTGVRNNRPTAPTVIERLAFGAKEHRERLGAPGCAAITLHGRSREQRYTKLADWGYIGECAALIKSYNEKKDALTDTIGEPDASTLPNSKDSHMYFLGNGDCYSHTDYYNAIENARVDSVMIGRGALIKPWLFEEIERGQYLDKSASERLAYIEKFVKYGLEAWGSDELGVGFTRRFLLEWLSFAHRYVPVAMLEHLPPKLNERPPAYHGRNDLETLMASDDYKDWIKLS